MSELIDSKPLETAIEGLIVSASANNDADRVARRLAHSIKRSLINVGWSDNQISEFFEQIGAPSLIVGGNPT